MQLLVDKSSTNTLPPGQSGIIFISFDEFDLIEKAPSTEAFDKADMEGIALEEVPLDKPGTHIKGFPLDQNVVTFP
jgi:hypothetical protein